MSEQDTLPCARCGAPMREVSGRWSDVEIAVTCDWCGAREGLPAEAAERIRVLRVKAAERRWAEEATRGPALAIARMLAPGASGPFGSVVSGLGSMIALMLGAGAIVALGCGGEGLVGSPVLLSLPPLVFAVIGVTIAYLVARHQIMPSLTPLFAAGPPPQPGALLRCRRCGADLPGSHAAFVDCAHCRAANLVTPEALAERVRLQDDAAARARRAARNNRAMVEKATRRISTWLSTGLFAGLTLGLSLTFLLTP